MSITLAVVNANVWTGDPSRPRAEALALADERIVHVGTTDEVRALAGDARVIDAGGRFVTPGFIDTHVHFIDGGFRLILFAVAGLLLTEEALAAIAIGMIPMGMGLFGGNQAHVRISRDVLLRFVGGFLVVSGATLLTRVIV